MSQCVAAFVRRWSAVMAVAGAVGACGFVETPVDVCRPDLCAYAEVRAQCSEYCLGLCGNGALDGGEECDDGNARAGDGCSADCVAVEAGYACDEHGEPCVAVPDPACGDGVVHAGRGEACDDGNKESGDGCSGDCAVESGWTCAAEPSVCATACGDGKVRGQEACDDGNRAYDDGCSDACRVEPHFVCAVGEPSRCDGVCGDGIVRGSEECDDGDLAPGDGCGPDCTVHPDYSCTGQPSECVPRCDDYDDDGYGVGLGCVVVDCDNYNGNVYPGYPEACNDVDDDCDGLTDEDTDIACYSGVAGTLGKGACVAGVQRCVGGVYGACSGEVLPASETCNGVDDDCNDAVDDNLPEIVCGVGVCQVTQSSCSGGAPAVCNAPLPAGTTDDCGGGDDDCDGAIDEDCTACVHVAQVGGDDSTGGGTATSPYATVDRAIVHIQNTVGSPTVVCVGGAPGCASVGPAAQEYVEDIVLPDGVTLLGGFDPTQLPWPRAPGPTACETIIRSSSSTEGLVIPSGATSLTVIDGFTLKPTSVSASEVAVLSIYGPGAHIHNCHVLGSTTGSRDNSYGIVVEGAFSPDPLLRPRIINSRVEGGQAVSYTAAIWSKDSNVLVRGACPGGALSGGVCTSTCAPGELAIVGTTAGGAVPLWSDGVFLDSSPGALVDQSAICTTAAWDASAVAITGDASNTVVSRSVMDGRGGSDSNVGVFAGDCWGTSPLITSNYSITADGSLANAQFSAGVEVVGDCRARIEDNTTIAARSETVTLATRGIYCGPDVDAGGVAAPRCEIRGNGTIKGAAVGVPNDSWGVECLSGGCGVIEDNASIDGHSGSTVGGILLGGGVGTLIRRNSVEGGCGDQVYGIKAIGATARLENNVIAATGNSCDAQSLVGLMATSDGLSELDVHSNHLRTGTGSCTQALAVSLGLTAAATAGASSGVLRNNIVELGYCPSGGTAAGVWVGQGIAPRIVQANDFFDPLGRPLAQLYCSGDGTMCSSAAPEIDARDGDALGFSMNLSADPMWAGITGGFRQLDCAASPLLGKGTRAGAPPTDFEGDVRGDPPDIGPDECP